MTKRERLERLSLGREYLLRKPRETEKARETQIKTETDRWRQKSLQEEGERRRL